MKCSLCILCGADKLTVYDYDFYRPNGQAMIMFHCDACGKYTRALFRLEEIAPRDDKKLEQEYSTVD